MNVSLLEAALTGYRLELEKIDAAMAAIQQRIGGKAATPFSKPAAAGRKGRLSAAARKRIAEAQKKRWAAYHKAKSAA